MISRCTTTEPVISESAGPHWCEILRNISRVLTDDERFRVRHECRYLVLDMSSSANPEKGRKTAETHILRNIDPEKYFKSVSRR